MAWLSARKRTASLLYFGEHWLNGKNGGMTLGLHLDHFSLFPPVPVLLKHMTSGTCGTSAGCRHPQTSWSLPLVDWRLVHLGHCLPHYCSLPQTLPDLPFPLAPTPHPFNGIAPWGRVGRVPPSLCLHLLLSHLPHISFTNPASTDSWSHIRSSCPLTNCPTFSLSDVYLLYWLLLSPTWLCNLCSLAYKF